MDKTLAERDKEYWIDALKNAHERLGARRIRLDALDVERGELTNEILQLEKLIQSIEPFTTDRPLDVINKICEEFTIEPDEGLADACRRVLHTTQRYMTPQEIRDILEASNYDLKQHNNPLASIHGILKRFDQSGEVSSMSHGSKTVYRIHPSNRAVIGSIPLRASASFQERFMRGPSKSITPEVPTRNTIAPRRKKD
jgi:hypothetical protein